MTHTLPPPAVKPTTEKEMRLAVAEDVLSHFQEFKPATGAWLVLTVVGKCRERVVSGWTDLRDLVLGGTRVPGSGGETDVPTCRACAVGACFLSYARVYGGVSMPHMRSYAVPSFVEYSSSVMDTMRAQLGEDQMNHIELAFEGGYGETSRYHCSDADAALAFYAAYAEPRDRLLAIMLNIVKNGGDFVPSDVYEYRK